MHNLQAGRVDWVDTAKGFCIIMVVMMHSTLGVGAAAGHEGWLHDAVAFAKPFRMPDFFLISGLFLARVIDRDWKTYLDRKVVHFLYFYVLWVTIQFAFKAPGLAGSFGFGGVAFAYLEAFVEPFGTLWFIYLLPVFFVVTKLLRNAPPLVVWLIAAALEIAPIHTGWIMIDEFAARFVYFYSGYLFANHIFRMAGVVQTRPFAAALGLTLWAFINGAMVFSGLSELPGLGLLLGFFGAAAVVTAAALLAMSRPFEWLRYCGTNSLVIYLAFFLPMAVTRTILLKLGVLDVGTVSLLVTMAGVVGALAWYWAVRGTPLRFLFERPALFRLDTRRKPQPAMQPAE
jgi:uncharacterized membrane protein YcfT